MNDLKIELELVRAKEKVCKMIKKMNDDWKEANEYLDKNFSDWEIFISDLDEKFNDKEIMKIMRIAKQSRVDCKLK